MVICTIRRIKHLVWGRGVGAPKRGYTSRPGEGGACLFFQPGIPPPPSRHVDMDGTPSKVPLGGGIPHFPGWVSRRSLIRSHCPGGSSDPTPHRSFAEGGACPALLVGGGTPAFASPVNGRHPPKGTQGGTPLPFSGTGLHRRLNPCHRPERGSGGGTPTVPTVQDPHPPQAMWIWMAPPSKVPLGGGISRFPGLVSRRSLIRSHCPGGSSDPTPH